MTLEQNETVNMKQSQGNDELDLFDILELLWAKKWIIVCSVLLGVIIGFGYLKFEKQNTGRLLIILLIFIPYERLIIAVQLLDMILCVWKMKQTKYSKML